MPARFVRQLGEMEELVEEILIRLPPAEPGHLLRSSLVCKPWLRLLSSPGFRRRYRDFHRTPPMLGFVCSWPTTPPVTEFYPSTDFYPRQPKDLHDRYYVQDSRHGRVLLKDEDLPLFLIWVPVTGSQTVLRRPELPGTGDCTASVLCAEDSCGHGDCHLGPFLVVFVRIDLDAKVIRASVYSSETGNWSSPVSLDVGFVRQEIGFTDMPSVLVGDALYFPISLDSGHAILKYDLAESSLLAMRSPWSIDGIIGPILMASDDGRLGFADLIYFDLSLWWVEVDPNGVESWSQPTNINLTAILPVGDPETSPELVGSIEGTSFIFATTDLGTYMIDLKSLSLKEITDILCQQEDLTWCLFPYLSFYSPPALAGTGVMAEASSEPGHGDDEA